MLTWLRNSVQFKNNAFLRPTVIGQTSHGARELITGREDALQNTG